MKQTPFRADDIDRARELLGLGDRASIQEIKIAYRRMCKQWHPDALDDDSSGVGKIKDINAAYRLLLEYCESYRFSFSPEDVEIFDPEKWWYDRFGENIRMPEDESGD
jgi:hypothetical protein